ncbi:MAG TPA: DNA gyrase inhibitor YacG [Steroidobacteraceae bacterium]|nr:DNA gyrase inhibitor YacG [Steroidobacteraceae bacterium]
MSAPRVKCPTCRREIDWANAPFRPFCSERCRLIDLGAWLSEQRAIPGDPTHPDPEPNGAPSTNRPDSR